MKSVIHRIPTVWGKKQILTVWAMHFLAALPRCTVQIIMLTQYLTSNSWISCYRSRSSISWKKSLSTFTFLQAHVHDRGTKRGARA